LTASHPFNSAGENIPDEGIVDGGIESIEQIDQVLTIATQERGYMVSSFEAAAAYGVG